MLIKALISQRVAEALARAREAGALTEVAATEIVVEQPQNPQHGEYATSLPLRLARTLHMNPLDIAQRLAPLIELGRELQEAVPAPPGFINFRVSPSWQREQVDAIIAAGERYGDLDIGRGQRVQVEFVSVNPTGPIHVGHTRGAVLGSTLADILQTAGYQVTREYYVNDAGSQMDAFYRSLYARYRQSLGEPADLPANGYVGAYMVDLAREIAAQEGDRFLHLPEEQATRELGAIGLQRMLQAIREDLERIRVRFDVWFSERSLYESSQYDTVMDTLRQRGYLAEREGATWFVSTALGEDKDNVLIRGSGAPTYFASDAAYHYNKFLVRGFEQVVDIWGADHQGHVNRVKAMVAALGADPAQLKVLLAQMVALKRRGEAVRVSKRTGELVTLRELVEEVGPDACRFFFLSRSPEAQMEFDLELAKQQSQENPVYYVQYGHARIAGILRNARERGVRFEDGDVQLLTTPEEMALVRKLLHFPELIESMAQAMEPHHLPHYAMELATAFHWFYDRCRVISDDLALTRARLKLVEATRVVLARSLHLMGMETPERM